MKFVRTNNRYALISVSIGVALLITSVLISTIIGDSGNQLALMFLFLLALAFICGGPCRFIMYREKSIDYLRPMSVKPKQPSADITKDGEPYKTCPNCGAKVSDYFCTHCGNKIE